MTLPWAVRYAIAAYEYGNALPPWLEMSAQYALNGFGCGCVRSTDV